MRSYFQTSKSHICLPDKSGSEELPGWLKAGRCPWRDVHSACIHRASLLRLQHQELADWAAAFHSAGSALGSMQR